MYVIYVVYVLGCLGQASAQAINAHGKYLIQQGVDENGTIFMYSPYYLWNEGLSLNPPTLNTPLALRSTNGRLNVELTVQAERITTQLFDYTARVFCYTGICSAPGPSLYVLPGDILSITLINTLEDSAGFPTSGPLKGTTTYPNRTNIFIQGLALDPALNSPYRYTSGGDSLHYEYVIPANTPPGKHQ
jgi:FtsP/CotA-like multicopper oxidase with cupredoxin domain